MSLIHDSLRKLEKNQSDSQAGLDSNVKNFKAGNGFDAKKMWVLVFTIFGIALIVYAYYMLEKYQKQNETLLNDMKILKSNGSVSQGMVEAKKPRPIEKLIVQPPITIVKQKEPSSYASKVTTVDQKYNNDKTVQMRNETKPLKQTITSPNDISNGGYLLNKKSSVVNTQAKTVKPKKKIYKKNNKLSIKQTRQLVNNLKIQIENKNTEKVTSLLKKLSLSSGENSLVYLRMNAYWSTTIKDDVVAASMYKKILFQNPQDIQANTNLALLEARNDNVEQAISRLKALRLEYPTNKNIVSYLERVEGLNVK